MGWLARMFLLLLAANLLVALWFWLRAVGYLPGEVQLADSTYGGPPAGYISLIDDAVLASRSEGVPAVNGFGSEVVVAGASELVGAEIDNDSPLCYSLGGFISEEEAKSAMEGSSQPYRILIFQVAEGVRYRARSEVLPDREAGRVRLSDLRAAIARAGASIDSYLVTTGPLANAVSLGLFGEQENALSVQRILAEQGEDIVVEQEDQLQNRFKILSKDVYHFENNRENWLLAGYELVPVAASENLCETIAQAE